MTEAQYQTMGKNEKLAFLINAYNAFTLKLIIDNYPVKSIRDLGGFLSSVFKKDFFQFRGAERSLGEVEHEMIRKEFDEPRIHFAINCASVGCPALRNEAFTPKTLMAQLEEQKITFLKDTSRNRYDAKTKKLYISKIFDWFDDDFEKAAGSVKAYVLEVLAPNQNLAQVEIEDYTEYDWRLNDLGSVKTP